MSDTTKKTKAGARQAPNPLQTAVIAELADARADVESAMEQVQNQIDRSSEAEETIERKLVAAKAEVLSAIENLKNSINKTELISKSEQPPTQENAMTSQEDSQVETADFVEESALKSTPAEVKPIAQQLDDLPPEERILKTSKIGKSARREISDKNSPPLWGWWSYLMWPFVPRKGWAENKPTNYFRWPAAIVGFLVIWMMISYGVINLAQDYAPADSSVRTLVTTPTLEWTATTVEDMIGFQVYSPTFSPEDQVKFYRAQVAIQNYEQTCLELARVQSENEELRQMMASRDIRIMDLERKIQEAPSSPEDTDFLLSRLQVVRQENETLRKILDPIPVVQIVDGKIRCPMNQISSISGDVALWQIGETATLSETIAVEPGFHTIKFYKADRSYLHGSDLLIRAVPAAE